MRKSLSQLASYQSLHKHALEVKPQTMRELFVQNPNRFDEFSQEFDQLLVDYSKNLLTQETIDKLLVLLNECEFDSWRTRMFAGEPINHTENRGVQHAAIRNLDDSSSAWGKKLHGVLQQMQNFVEEVRTDNFTDVVNIGIGGSHLGPMMVCDALTDFAKPGLNVHFVANVDATDINRVLGKLNPATTLFIITSKTFTTQETLANANTAKNWLTKNAHGGKNLSKHFVAVSANVDNARTFGIPEQNIFPMWDEIGGRYSLWSAVGLSIALYIGMSAFKQLLRGANVMDQHFRNAPSNENIPVLLALIEIWNQHFLNASVTAVLPYNVRLTYLPAFLQQLVMESNGKYVDREGNVLDVPSSPIVFGDVGTNSQHSFFQLLHQGTHTISCEFIGIAKASHNNYLQHDMLLANLIGQTQALMLGQTEEEARAQGEQKFATHKMFPGNRFSNTIFLKELTPHTLGLLLAMYEHKTFVQGIILNINSFDQMGVELGKRLANKLLKKIQDGQIVTDEDSSTNALINFYKKYK